MMTEGVLRMKPVSHDLKVSEQAQVHKNPESSSKVKIVLKYYKCLCSINMHYV